MDAEYLVVDLTLFQTVATIVHPYIVKYLHYIIMYLIGSLIE